MSTLYEALLLVAASALIALAATSYTWRLGEIERHVRALETQMTCLAAADDKEEPECSVLTTTSR